MPRHSCRETVEAESPAAVRSGRTAPPTTLAIDPPMKWTWSRSAATNLAWSPKRPSARWAIAGELGFWSVAGGTIYAANRPLQLAPLAQ